MPSATKPSLDFEEFYNIIDGNKYSSDKFHRSINPATRGQLWPVPIAKKEDVDRAVAAGHKAFRLWSATPIEARKEQVQRFVDLWALYTNEFTELLCAENGKPRVFAEGEVKSVNAFMNYPLAHSVPEEVFEDDEKIVKTTYTALGVCAGICPWNFPLGLAAGKIAPAIVAGNAIIIKPSPFTPYSTLKMVELMQQTFPPGVVQVIGGDHMLGPMLTSHPDIAKVSFTGSIATGKRIMQACAGTLKRITLELGGNDAAIVCSDVDIAKVAPEVATGAFINSGQVCVATKRIYIHESIYQPFLKAMAEYTKKLVVGEAHQKDAFIGPIQNEMQFEKVKELYNDCGKKGYAFATGNAEVVRSEGYFISPAIIDNPPDNSRIMLEEPFGPIVPCQPFKDESEVIERANNSSTGLGACVWSADVEKAVKIGNQLEGGSVFINSFEKVKPDFYFSGHKESGIGGEWGRLGCLAYYNAKVVHIYK